MSVLLPTGNDFRQRYHCSRPPVHICHKVLSREYTHCDGTLLYHVFYNTVSGAVGEEARVVLGEVARVVLFGIV